MIIKTQITFREYIRLLYGLIYRKPVMILLMLVDLAMIVWIAGFYSGVLPLPEPTIYQYITLVLITIVQPLVIFNTLWRSYRSSNHLQEMLEIEFTDQEIKMQAESFFMEIKWEKVFKVVEYRNWFLIYQNTLSAIIIPKGDFRGGELPEFISLLKKIKGIPVYLKKEN
jgi:hypothetical protein